MRAATILLLLYAVDDQDCCPVHRWCVQSTKLLVVIGGPNCLPEIELIICKLYVCFPNISCDFAPEMKFWRGALAVHSPIQQHTPCPFKFVLTPQHKQKASLCLGEEEALTGIGGHEACNSNYTVAGLETGQTDAGHRWECCR